MSELIEVNRQVTKPVPYPMPAETEQALAEKVVYQQLLLDMYQGELQSALDPLRQQKLKASIESTGQVLWQYRLHGAEYRNPGFRRAGSDSRGPHLLFRKHHAFHHRPIDDGHIRK